MSARPLSGKVMSVKEPFLGRTLKMNFIAELVRKAFEWALFLALIGGLGEATATLYREAGAARAHGLIHLRALNRSLGLREARSSSRP